MTGLEACLDDWGPKAIVFLEQRRLDISNESLQMPEDLVFAQIDRSADLLASYATGERIKELREDGDALRNIGFVDVPVTPLMERVFAEFYGNNEERIHAQTKTWTSGPNAIYDGFIEWFDLRRVLSAELLRHRKLLSEQRELMQFMKTHPGLTVLDYHQQWFAEGRAGDATGQYIAFQWARAWNLVQSFSGTAKRLSPESWKKVYTTVLGTTHTPKLYLEMLPYLHELASLSFETAPDVSRRLLGGVLYTTILDEEKADCLKHPVAAALEQDLQRSNPFLTRDFVLFDSARAAGYLAPDEGKWFVFKVTDQAEVDVLAIVTDVMRDPTRILYLDTEIEHAVRNSLALMHGQGFEQLGQDWEIYLRASGKIPSSFILHEKRGFEDALIPDLSARIYRELEHYGMAFRGDPKGPISQAPGFGKKRA